jgi:hypothetical protein
VLGKTFPEGTVLSVPTYSLHRNEQAWGEDVNEFRPERWLDGKVDHSEMLKSFNPFSFGPRCVSTLSAKINYYWLTYVAPQCLCWPSLRVHGITNIRSSYLS